MQPDNVTFVDEPAIREKIRAALAELRPALAVLLPGAQIEHIGATSVPGSVTKGDLDLCVVVEQSEFADTDRKLGERFSRNVRSNKTESLSSFVDDSKRVPVGIQLVGRGGPEDFFVQWRELLLGSPCLLAAYNALKQRWQGRSHAEYRAEKAAFIERELKLSREAGNPWLRVTASDYEGHMNAVGQAAILRAMFFRLYAERQPKRLAVLGCTTGGDLQLVDAATTELAVGVDLNAAYLEIARGRLAALGARLRLIEGDVLRVELGPGQLDLVHAALLLEYVEPLSLFRRIHEWLAPGGVCSVITQSPQPDVRAVTKTGYRTMELLAGKMRLRDEGQVATLARQCGFSLLRPPVATSVGGKTLVGSVFRK